MDTNALRSVFPKTLELLEEKRIAYLREQFGKTLKDDLMITLTVDTSRWFPVFLKFQGVRSDVLEVAEFEYLRHTVKTVNMGKTKADPEEIKINPSIQFIELHHDQPKLSRTTGLYCFFKMGEAFCEFKLGISEALILDLLHQERKYNFAQLALAAIEHKQGMARPLGEWENTISDMLRIGILTGV